MNLSGNVYNRMFLRSKSLKLFADYQSSRKNILKGGWTAVENSEGNLTPPGTTCFHSHYQFICFVVPFIFVDSAVR